MTSRVDITGIVDWIQKGTFLSFSKCRNPCKCSIRWSMGILSTALSFTGISI